MPQRRSNLFYPLIVKAKMVFEIYLNLLAILVHRNQLLEVVRKNFFLSVVL